MLQTGIIYVIPNTFNCTKHKRAILGIYLIFTMWLETKFSIEDLRASFKKEMLVKKIF